jgi:trans-aconitate methyltransferase
MAQFRNAHDSHEHSLQILDLIYLYDSFLDSLSVVADMGCGEGLDVEWWATLETRDDPPEPRNYLVYAIDENVSRLSKEITDLPNVKPIKANFEDPKLTPRKIDLIWSHDTFQYAINPMQTLKQWNEMMSTNGMLMLSMPQNVHYLYNRVHNNSYSGCYYNHNITSLIYMLAVNGFDCNDAYFYKNMNDPWLYAAVYKTDHKPMDPKKTSWHDLVEKNLVNESIKNSINRNNYVRQEDILTTWLDKDFYRIRE